jgi:perosamine synthetase
VVTPGPRIPVAGPSITASELAAVQEAAAHAWYERAGSYVQRFERAFAARHGSRFAVALPSCTSAIHLALAARGIGPGDEVVVPDLTWIASIAPAVQLGATPVFADVDPRTWCLDVDSLLAVASERTRAVVAVDLYGNLPDFARLRQVCRERGWFLLEDAAEAIGTTAANGDDRARAAGTFGDAGVFSFHGSKTLTTGEGGMLLTDDAELHRRVRVLQDHGRTPGDRSFACDEVAFKYKMTDLQAALGLGQLARLDDLVARKRAIFASYHQRLGDLPGVTWNDAGPGVQACPWMTTLVLQGHEPGTRDQLRQRLAAAGIDSRPFFPPLSQTPAFAHATDAPRAQRCNQHAIAIGPRGLNLPSALSLTEPQIERVAAVVREVLA